MKIYSDTLVLSICDPVVKYRTIHSCSTLTWTVSSFLFMCDVLRVGCDGMARDK